MATHEDPTRSKPDPSASQRDAPERPPREPGYQALPHRHGHRAADPGDVHAHGAPRLSPAGAHAGHDKHAGHSVEMFVARIVALSKASYRKMVQNLWWAAGYNIVAIPLAPGVLAPQGLILHPALAAVLVSASTVIVAINAQLLRRVSLEA